jgi:hypothetical protein
VADMMSFPYDRLDSVIAWAAGTGAAGPAA